MSNFNSSAANDVYEDIIKYEKLYDTKFYTFELLNESIHLSSIYIKILVASKKSLKKCLKELIALPSIDKTRLERIAQLRADLIDLKFQIKEAIFEKREEVEMRFDCCLELEQLQEDIDALNKELDFMTK